MHNIVGWTLGIGLIGSLLVFFWPTLSGKAKRIVNGPDLRLPHERYPRILNWRKGDTFRRRDGQYWPSFYAGHAKLLGLTQDGRVFLQDYQQKWSLSVDDVCKCCWNANASDREISEEIKESRGYTQALLEFNKSVRALHSRDKKNGVELPDQYYPEVPADLYM